MIKYHIAIVEDEQHHADHLKNHLATFSKENNVLFDIDIHRDGHDILEDYKSDYDIIFLDIELLKLNGMETAERIRKIDDNVTIIFVTNLAQFAIKGYEVDAHSFLIKPVQYFKFSREIKKVLDKISNRKHDYVVVNTDDGIRKVDTSDIVYIESMKHELTINTMDQQFSMWGTLKELEIKLKPYHFFRSNNCYVVNLATVKGIDGDFALVGNERLKISRSRKKEFMDALTDYFRGGL